MLPFLSTAFDVEFLKHFTTFMKLHSAMYVLSTGIEGIETWTVSYKQRWEQESRFYGFLLQA